MCQGFCFCFFVVGAEAYPSLPRPRLLPWGRPLCLRGRRCAPDARVRARLGAPAGAARALRGRAKNALESAE